MFGSLIELFQSTLLGSSGSLVVPALLIFILFAILTK